MQKVSAELNPGKILFPYVFSKSLFYTINVLWLLHNSNPIDLTFQEIFTINMQARNHIVDSVHTIYSMLGTAWAIEMTADRGKWTELPMGAIAATHTGSYFMTMSSGGQVFYLVCGLGRQPTDRNRIQFRS